MKGIAWSNGINNSRNVIFKLKHILNYAFGILRVNEYLFGSFISRFNMRNGVCLVLIALTIVVESNLNGLNE